jgi:hypothetical protein
MRLSRCVVRQLLIAGAVNLAFPEAWCQEKLTVDLRGKEAVPKDLKENDPKPPRLVIKEPPSPPVQKRKNHKEPRSVSAVRD